MVLVDTSIWLRYFSRSAHNQWELARLLDLEQVLAHELVRGELLIGDPAGRVSFLEDYQRLRHAQPIPHDEVVAFVHRYRLYGRGAGWNDVHLLASALATNAMLWTADRNLVTLALEFGICYSSSGGSALPSVPQ